MLAMCSDEVHFLSERSAGLYWRSTRRFTGHAFDADINYSLEISRKALKNVSGNNSNKAERGSRQNKGKTRLDMFKTCSNSHTET